MLDGQSSPSREAVSFAGFICRAIDRIVSCLDELDEQGLNWRPPAIGANSVYTLAVHTMANAEENILGTVCGQAVARSREQEFLSRAPSAEPLQEYWRRLRTQIEDALTALPSGELDREREHPRRGSVTGREVLLVVARHSAEHMGQAELTRDLLRAIRIERPPST
ncbi:MAG: DinB family protein [Dehalococcoidia bacterium]